MDVVEKKDVDVEGLVKQYERLVHKIVRRIKQQFPSCEETHGFTYEDLAQLGRIGLFNAARKFDPERGLQFMTFAYPHIDGHIRRHLREGHMIKVSRSIVDALYAIKKYQLEQAPPEEISEKLGISVRIARQAKSYQAHYDSMDKLISIGGSEDKKATLGDMIPSPDSFEEHISNRDVLQTFFATLSPQEKRIWYLYNVGGMRQSEVAKEVGFSQAHISRILRGVKRKATEFGKRVGVSSYNDSN